MNLKDLSNKFASKRNGAPGDKPVHKGNEMGYMMLFLLVSYVAICELTTQSLFKKNSFAIVWSWIGEGEAWGMILFFWALTAFIWLVLTASHLYMAYVAMTGRTASYILLGDKLEDGQYVYREDDQAKRVMYVPRFVNQDTLPNSSFNNVYTREFFITDRRGNLMNVRNLNPIRNFLMVIFQVFMLACGFGCFNAVLEFHHKQFTSSDGMGSLLIFGAIVHLGGWILIAINKPNVLLDSGRALPIPASVKEGEIIKGKIIGTAYHASMSEKKTHYKMFTMCFDGTSGFDIPVYATWMARRIGRTDLDHLGDKRELKALQKVNDQAFEQMEAVMREDKSVDFVIDPDKCPVPQLYVRLCQDLGEYLPQDLEWIVNGKEEVS